MEEKPKITEKEAEKLVEDYNQNMRELRKKYAPDLDREKVKEHEAEHRRLTYEQIKLVYEIVDEKEEDYD